MRKSFRLDVTGRKGGLLVFVNNDIPSKYLRIFYLPGDIQAISFQINLKQRKLRFVSIYRPPDKKLDYVNNQLDRQEQYSRRNCLLLHGVDETDHEVTDDIIIKTIKDKMDVEITPESIDRTHRLGKKQQNTGRPRPIIVKFSTYNTRHKIFRNKKVLKGKGVSITESLIQKRVELLKKAREEHGFKSVWTQDGKILFVGNVDNKIKVYYD